MEIAKRVSSRPPSHTQEVPIAEWIQKMFFAPNGAGTVILYLGIASARKDSRTLIMNGLDGLRLA
ncbi:hypothetical protein PSHT_16232 [Puccinia striiformis]|uniref:Uncharacterized protein n=1 Tax=Puccinia striiformis TaxID=27350 RepID=A0A2S4UAV2_9BASI|nr:hypothetical protein PSHT_16232 [Puccinia striiformis]